MRVYGKRESRSKLQKVSEEVRDGEVFSCFQLLQLTEFYKFFNLLRMFQQYIALEKKRFENTIVNFKKELAKIRTGRASSSLLDGIFVEVYGSKMPIEQLATIHIPEPRTITISPWDKGNAVQIEAAIRDSDLGLNPANDGQVIRLNLPSLTEERRGELVKMVGKRAEEARIAVRRIREDIWSAIQKAQEAGEFGEDEKFSGKEALQKVVDEYNEKIEEVRKKKEEEVRTV